MAIICWGSLAKSANDTTRVEQSIQHYVGTHDENPNAHMGEDYALGAHRLATALDHVDGSVRFVHLAMDSQIGMSVFESLDGWTTDGFCYAGVFGASIQTDLVSVINPAYMITNSRAGSPYIKFDKNPFFQTTVRLGQLFDCTYYFTAGDMKIDIDNNRGFGFKVVDDQLYAVWADGSGEETELIQTITQGDFCLRAYIDSTEEKIYFYVNGVLVHTESDIDTSAFTMEYFLYYAYTDDAFNKAYSIKDWLFQQDR